MKPDIGFSDLTSKDNEWDEEKVWSLLGKYQKIMDRTKNDYPMMAVTIELRRREDRMKEAILKEDYFELRREAVAAVVASSHYVQERKSELGLLSVQPARLLVTCDYPQTWDVTDAAYAYDEDEQESLLRGLDAKYGRVYKRKIFRYRPRRYGFTPTMQALDAREPDGTEVEYSEDCYA